MRRKKSSLPRRAGLLAIAAALSAAVAAAAGTRLGRRRTVAPGTKRDLRRFQRDAAGYTCECGQKYKVTGVDRHRVYWPAGAGEDQPVLGTQCVACERPLPAGHDTAVAG